jgi:hypothetical protein
MEIKLTLSDIDVNSILEALGDKPYRFVEPIITSIRMQAVPQVTAAKMPASDSPKSFTEGEDDGRHC